MGDYELPLLFFASIFFMTSLETFPQVHFNMSKNHKKKKHIIFAVKKCFMSSTNTYEPVYQVASRYHDSFSTFSYNSFLHMTKMLVFYIPGTVAPRELPVMLSRPYPGVTR